MTFYRVYYGRLSAQLGLEAIKSLRVVPGDLSLVGFGYVLTTAKHLYRIRPGRIPMRIVGRVQQFIGANPVDDVRHRRLLQLEGIEELFACHILARLLFEQRRLSRAAFFKFLVEAVHQERNPSATSFQCGNTEL